MTAWITIMILGPVFAARGAAPDAAVLIRITPEATFEIQTQGAQLQTVLSQIETQLGVSIVGLPPELDAPVYFIYQGPSLERALKNFLRYLDQENYALEYQAGQLHRVRLFPKGDGAKAPPSSAQAHVKHEPQPSRISPMVNLEGVLVKRYPVVRVVDIIEGTQAEEIGIQKGDIVATYDNIKVKNPNELVKAVKAKDPEELVDLTVIRDGGLLSFMVNGGMIGINIRTEAVTEEEVGDFFED